MSAPTCLIDTTAFVALGQFPPRLFSPELMAAKELLADHEARAAEVGVIYTELTAFKLDWGTVEVTPDKLQVTSGAGYHAKLRDFCASVLRVYEVCPVWAVGMNRLMHFRVALETRDTVLRRLLPAEPWPSEITDPAPLTARVTGSRPGSGGRLSVVVEPSTKVEGGLFVSTNEEHRLVDTPDTANDTRLALDTLEAHFLGALDHGLVIAQALVRPAPEQS
jgi:hypothetical protein